MNKYFHKHFVSLMLLLGFALFILLSYINHWSIGLLAQHNFGKSSKEMLGLLPVMFILTELYHLAIFLPLKQAFMSILGKTRISITATIS
ncbi:MAG: hypothetical protein RBS43_07330, partial [Candidatus Cloacimonas sp.]|nr:hypothetical protein [Candidatus Cloacimonas sp.]